MNDNSIIVKLEDKGSSIVACDKKTREQKPIKYKEIRWNPLKQIS